MALPDHHTAADVAAIRAWVAVLAREPRSGDLLELRRRLPDGEMTKRFFPADRPARLVEAIARFGRRSDVYVGCALRARRERGRGAYGGSWVAWADCDTPESVARLDSFSPSPTMVVRSGGRGGCHAYWALDEPASPWQVEAANRSLARRLDADEACFDATRILRPPSTLNFKYEPPAPVTLEICADHRRYPLSRLSEGLPRPTPEPGRAPPAGGRHHGDPIRDLEPAQYVSALLGVEVPRHRKVRCPFHRDEHPSLHVYPAADQGWFCFSCRRGGSAYDLAAALWGVDTRGAAFRSLRRRLTAELGLAPPTHADALDR